MVPEGMQACHTGPCLVPQAALPRPMGARGGGGGGALQVPHVHGPVPVPMKQNRNLGKKKKVNLVDCRPKIITFIVTIFFSQLKLSSIDPTVSILHTSV